MGVYIKGMEMPKNCADCDLEQCDENYYGDQFNFQCPLGYKAYTKKTREIKRLENCPLIEVPEHGRLIDADALFEEAYKVWGFDADASDCSVLMQLINDAPTIIPADKEGT